MPRRSAIAPAGVSGARLWVAPAAFVVVPRITVAALVLYSLVARRSAERALNNWKAWLSANNATVMLVLLLPLGAKPIGDGLGGLVG